MDLLDSKANAVRLAADSIGADRRNWDYISIEDKEGWRNVVRAIENFEEDELDGEAERIYTAAFGDLEGLNWQESREVTKKAYRRAAIEARKIHGVNNK